MHSIAFQGMGSATNRGTPQHSAWRKAALGFAVASVIALTLPAMAQTADSVTVDLSALNTAASDGLLIPPGGETAAPASANTRVVLKPPKGTPRYIPGKVRPIKLVAPVLHYGNQCTCPPGRVLHRKKRHHKPMMEHASASAPMMAAPEPKPVAPPPAPPQAVAPKPAPAAVTPAPAPQPAPKPAPVPAAAPTPAPTASQQTAALPPPQVLTPPPRPAPQAAPAAAAPTPQPAAKLPEQQVAAVPPAPQPAAPKAPEPMRIVYGSGTGIPADADPVLKELTQRMMADASLRVQILAYASDPEKNVSNTRRLSLARAVAVRKVLIDNGVDSSRIDIRPLGDQNAGGPPDRVDIVVSARR